MTEILYRSARAADAAAIAEIHVASWRDAYRSILNRAFLDGPIERDLHLSWLNKMSNASDGYFVELASIPQDRIVGFISVSRNHDRNWGSMIDNLHIMPEMRGQKIGEVLLRSVARRLVSEQAISGLHLWVFEANKAAVRFYERLGGQVVERALSQIPAANGKVILRIQWPVLSALV